MKTITLKTTEEAYDRFGFSSEDINFIGKLADTKVIPPQEFWQTQKKV